MLVFALGAYLLISNVDLHGVFLTWSRADQHAEIDELFAFLALMPLAFILVFLLRWRDLRKVLLERRQIEVALHRSEREYRGLFDSAHDAIFIFKPEDEVILEVNQRACEMYGFSRQEFIGMSLVSITRDVASGRKQIAETLERGLYHNFESAQYRKDGSLMYLEINASLVDYRGQPAILSINRDITKRKQAEAALAQRAEALARSTALISAFSQVATRLQSCHQPREIMDALGAGLTSLGLNCQIALLEPDTQELVIRYTSFDSKVVRTAERLIGVKAEGLRLSSNSPLYQMILENQSSRFVPDAAGRAFAVLPGLPKNLVRRAMKLIGLSPHMRVINNLLVVEGETIGVMSIIGEQLQEEDISAISIFAGQFAIALQNARLYETTQKRADELSALARVSSSLRRAQTRDELIPLLIDETIDVLHADSGAIILLEEHNMRFSGARGPGEAMLGEYHPEKNSPLWAIMLTGQNHFIPDVSSRSDFKEFQLTKTLLTGIKGCAFVPLLASDTIVGLFHIGYQTSHDFQLEETRLLTAIAEMAGSALQRTTVMQTLEQQVINRTRDLAALYSITSLASEMRDLNTALDKALLETLRAMRCESGAIHILEGPGAQLKLAVQHGITHPHHSFPIQQPNKNSFVHQALQQREPLLAQFGPGQAPPGHPGYQGEPRSHMFAPMRASGQVLGVVTITGEPGQVFRTEDITLLSSIADQVAVVVENIRLHHQAEQAAVMRERERLARDLHDSVTQSLYSLTLFAAAGRELVRSGELQRATGHFEDIVETAHDALKEMRLLVHELRPPVLEREGLTAALQNRLDAVEGRAGIKARLLSEPIDQLPIAVQEGFYRIAQEALNNALKHAAASEVEVHLRKHGAQIELEILDNGIGFKVDAAGLNGGMGLSNMRKRAEKLGGSLTLTSAPGRGTSVKAAVNAHLVPPQIEEAINV